MKSIIKFCFSIAIVFFTHQVVAQVVMDNINVQVQNGALFYIQTDSLLLENNALVIQNGYLRIDKDLVVNSGNLQNDGTIDINENLINNDEIEGVSAQSAIELFGNWTNNATFIPGNGTVYLDGTTQDINGTQQSNFYNLNCLGNLTDVKQLLGVDANVLNIFDLGGVEFATNTNNLSVLNTNTAAILRSHGFVSSLDNGRLNRATANQTAYIFPVGSSVGTIRYRPIEITPASANLNTYGVRLANTMATNEGFDVSQLEDSLCLINPFFYHRIYGNEASDIRMFYDLSTDGYWSDMAHWQNIPQWEDMGVETENNTSAFTTLEIQNWNAFTNPSFALAIKNPVLDLGSDLEADLGDPVNLNPTYSGSSLASFVWTPDNDLACNNCLNNIATLSETTELILTANENDHCSVSDTILIAINNGYALLPTGFSPNGDGVNDFFVPLNSNLNAWTMQVYNRWGELVFTSNDPLVGWDGSYRGRQQEIGVYSFVAEFQLEGDTETQTSTGNVTLIR